MRLPLHRGMTAPAKICELPPKDILSQGLPIWFVLETRETETGSPRRRSLLISKPFSAVWSSWTRPPIPRFQQVGLVNCSNDSRFCCSSCFQFERIGIPCVHIYAVVKEIDPSWEGFLLHHHVAVWWWSVFVCHGFGDEETEGNRNRRSCHRISKEGHCYSPFN